MNPPQVLLIEDEAALGAALETALRRVGCAVVGASTGQAGLQRLSNQSFSAVVLDIGLPDMSGLQVLSRLRGSHPLLPVLVITAHGHLENAIAARTAGATEYLVKPLDLRHFQQTVRALLESAMHPTGTSHETAQPPIFVGGAPSLQRAFAAIARACAHDGPVLVSGPGGCGKSLTASIIHAQSTRRLASCTTLTCGSLEIATLHAALTTQPEQTLILDEISALAAPAQSALAELLADGNLPLRRIIATTSVNLRQAATEGHFREDLFYRLGVAEIPLPLLSERATDIPALAASLLAGRDSAAPEITASALLALQSYPWPGNVRELAHVLDYALAASRGVPILLSHLPPHISAVIASPPSAETLLQAALREWIESLATPALPSYETLSATLERQLLLLLLPRYDGKPTRLATALQLHRSTLRQKMIRLGLSGEE